MALTESDVTAMAMLLGTAVNDEEEGIALISVALWVGDGNLSEGLQLLLQEKVRQGWHRHRLRSKWTCKKETP
jgi:hypothetical protein